MLLDLIRLRRVLRCREAPIQMRQRSTKWQSAPQQTVLLRIVFVERQLVAILACEGTPAQCDVVPWIDFPDMRRERAYQSSLVVARRQEGRWGRFPICVRA